MFDLYVVSDRHATRGRALIDVVAAAVRGGARAVQLRENDLSGRELVDLGRTLAALCRRQRVPLLVNDRVDVAVAIGAAGVHLPVRSFAPSEVRTLLRPDALIGCSTHSLAEARRAEQAGADFVVVGPVFATPSKVAFGPALGLDTLATITRTLSIPAIAIGGIDRDTAAAARAAGASGVAAIRAIMEADDPAAAARILAGR